MRLDNPEYLYFLLLIPLLTGFYFYYLSKKKKELACFVELSLQKELMLSYSPVRLHCKFALAMLALLVCVFLLARPQMKGDKITQKQGVEVLVALDVSNSMLAKDVAPSRLERAKYIISKLTESEYVSRMGLVVFAGDAFVQLPVTTDFSAIRMLLPSLSPALVSTQGTAIGAAIDKSMLLFSTEQNSASQLILVITDGENHEDNAVESAENARNKNAVVSVVGIGQTNGAPIPNADGSFRKNKGEIILSKLNENMCREIAAAGGGVFFNADNTNVVTQISKQLGDMASGNGETGVSADYVDVFSWFAGLALLLLLVELFVFERKKLKI